VTRSLDRSRQQQLAGRGVRVLAMDTQSEGGLSLRALLEQLGS
jgi:hypothetical protein